MKLVLIRHTSVAVERGVCYGRTDVDVAPTFDEEARVVAENLRKYSFDRVYSSPLSRCTKLAAACGFPEPFIEPRVIEMNFGEWEMKRFDDISDPRLQEWYDDYLNVASTGGESSVDQCRRFMDFVNGLRGKDYGTVAVFTHCGILLHAMVTLCGLTYEEALKRQPAYGAIMEIEI